MRTVILSAVLVSCAGSGDDVRIEALEALAGHPQEQVQVLRLGLHEAQRVWSEGRREEASVRVHQIYDEAFGPLEPLLRSVDPVETLALEYRFGTLARQFRRNSDALAVAETIQGITRGADALVAALPAEVLGPTPVAAPVVGPRVESAELPPHLQ